MIFNIRKLVAILAVCSLTILVSCQQQEPQEVSIKAESSPLQKNDSLSHIDRPKSSDMAISAPDNYAALAAEKILREGGNAIDAAVVAGFVLAVTFPDAGNIGGGGFLLTRMNGEDHFLDYREKAPAAAFRDMYIEEDGSVDGRKSLVGIKSAAVPGTVAGLWEAHQKFGTKPWAYLVEPAVILARDGFQVHADKAAEIPDIIEWFGEGVNFVDYFGEMKNAGVFKQPDLAATLSRIAEQGPKDFYHGETAQKLVSQMERDGGLVTAEDLQNYQAVWREPLTAQWREYSVITAPPPSSGGFAVLNLLRMKEKLDQEFSGIEHNSAQYVHLVAEMEKRIFADRAEYFGDPDFVDVPIQELISDAYVAKRAAEVNPRSISHIDDVDPGLDSPSTTHFSIIDAWGNVVSNTYTINWNYGSGVVVEGAGFILNNEMDDFSTKPGVGNIYGVVGGTANEIQPAKRMLSSMSPTMMFKGNDVEMVLGTPGGSTIFTSVFQAIVNVIDFDMSAAQAVGASRFHHQLLPPDLVTTSISLPLPDATKRQLENRGYRIEPHGWEFGDLQLIARKNGELTAASDPRGIGVSKIIRLEAEEN